MVRTGRKRSKSRVRSKTIILEDGVVNPDQTVVITVPRGKNSTILYAKRRALSGQYDPNDTYVVGKGGAGRRTRFNLDVTSTPIPYNSGSSDLNSFASAYGNQCEYVGKAKRDVSRKVRYELFKRALAKNYAYLASLLPETTAAVSTAIEQQKTDYSLLGQTVDRGRSQTRQSPPSSSDQSSRRGGSPRHPQLEMLDRHQRTMANRSQRQHTLLDQSRRSKGEMDGLSFGPIRNNQGFTSFMETPPYLSSTMTKPYMSSTWTKPQLNNSEYLPPPSLSNASMIPQPQPQSFSDSLYVPHYAPRPSRFRDQPRYAPQPLSHSMYAPSLSGTMYGEDERESRETITIKPPPMDQSCYFNAQNSDSFIVDKTNFGKNDFMEDSCGSFKPSGKNNNSFNSTEVNFKTCCGGSFNSANSTTPTPSRDYFSLLNDDGGPSHPLPGRGGGGGFSGSSIISGCGGGAISESDVTQYF